MTERYRNHPTVLLEKAFSMGVALLFMYLVTGNGMIEMLAAYTAVFVVGMVYSFAIWRRTWVSFEDTEIVVLRDTWVTKKTKRIQYSRLASVGVARSIINRICGTTRLIFNVNSSINANEPEATLTVDSELAERIRRELNSRIFSKESETAEEPEIETLVKVSNADIVIHAFISQPTARLVFAVLMLVYSFVSILYDSAGGLVIPLLLLAANEIIPLAKEILTYCNYRLYRVGDTITVESGLLSTVRMSFKVGKVNSVRMRQPLLARALGMCVLEAEVVGIAVAGDDAGTPLLCPLKKEAEVRGLMAKVMPEVVFEPESISQSRGAFMAMAVTNLLYICLAISVTVFFAVFVHPVIGETDGIDSALILVTEVFVAIGIPLLLVGACHHGSEEPQVRNGSGVVPPGIRRVRYDVGIHPVRQGAVHLRGFRSDTEDVRECHPACEHDVVPGIQGDRVRAVPSEGSGACSGRGHGPHPRRKVRPPQV